MVLSPFEAGEPEGEVFPWDLVQAETMERLEPRVAALTIDDILTRFEPKERVKIFEDMNYHLIAAAVMHLPPEQREAPLQDVSSPDREKIREHVATAVEANDTETDTHFREAFLNEVKAKILLGRFKLPEP